MPTPDISAVTIDLLANTKPQTTQATYALHVSRFRPTVTRMPVLFGLPTSQNTNPLTNIPKAWGLDLGMIQEIWLFEGQIFDWEDNEDPITPYIDASTALKWFRSAGTGSTGDISSSNFTNIVSPGGVIVHVGTGLNQGAAANSNQWDIKGYILNGYCERNGGVIGYDYQFTVGVTQWSANMFESEY